MNSLPILNHLAYLNSLGQKETGSHQSKEWVKLFYYDCGCVVIAEALPMLYFQHNTIPCPAHNTIRKHNYTYNDIDIISKRLKSLLMVDGKSCLMVDFLETNFFCLNSVNKGDDKISEADATIVYNLPIDGKHFIGTCTIQRIS